MMRILFLLQLLLLTTFNAFCGVRYTTTNLNMRYGPGTHYRVVKTIPKGTPVTIDEYCNCKWIAVNYNGKIGYVSSRYLSTYYRNTKPVKRQLRSTTGRGRYYYNSYGTRVQSPTHYNTIPSGATAICRDGTYSFSRNRRGTCSHHGGVARWLK